MNEAATQARPSPNIVRCSPGSLTKSLPATSLMAYTSPMCSITGAMATGIMNTIASQQSSGRTNAGNANQGASTMGWKSITPKQAATIYPITIPENIGIRRSIPLANSDTTTVVSSATIARGQLLFAMSTPVPANDRPMSMITGPTTTGGKRRAMKPTPRRRTSRLMRPYTAPTDTRPHSVPGRPNNSVALIIGAMNAKLLPRKMGTLPFVTAWKINVPKPAVKRATEGSSPTRSGTSTVAPNATNRNWAPTMVFCTGPRLLLFFIL